MMNEIKKNELNQQEMENVAGGGGLFHTSSDSNYRPSHKTDFDKAMDEFVIGVGETAVDAFNAVSEAGDVAWKVVKNMLEDMF